MSGGGVLEVHKFGGTSVSNLPTLIELVRREAAQGKRLVVVVSAFSAVTDQLLAAIAAALRGGTVEAVREALSALSEKHRKLAEPHAESVNVVHKLLAELESLLQGVALVRECTARTRDAIIAFGELLSGPIVAAALGAPFVDSRHLILTDDTFGNATVDFKGTELLCKTARLGEAPLVVVSGFIGKSTLGNTTTLGRSGSDYTATILASAVHAAKCIIWTDVYGVYSGDPRLISDTFTLPKVSYREAAEMAFFGSKVLFSKMMQPCERLDIPIEVRKTSLATDDPFTLISKESTLVAAISAIRAVAVLEISGPGMKGVAGMAASVFGALAASHVSALMVAQASSEQEICVCVEDADAERAREALRKRFEFELQLGVITDIELRRNLSIVNTVLGDACHKPGVASTLFAAAADRGVNLVAIAQPASELSISCVVSSSDLPHCLPAFHRALYPPAVQPLSVVVLGATGQVGSEVVRTLQKLTSHKVQIVAQCNSREIHFAQSSEPTAMSIQALIDGLKQRRVGSVHFVDCTCSQQVADAYEELLKLPGSKLSTCNKLAFCGPLQQWERLRPYMQNGRIRYSAVVGAGLPVLSTIKRLRSAGDKVVRVEGLLSGTLAYVFQRLASPEAPSLSVCVREAQKLGYTEPDPREDLSCRDFARKLVVCGREAGLETSPEIRWEGSLQLLTEQDAKAPNVEAFLQSLSSRDAEFAALAASARQAGEKLLVVGAVDATGVSLQLRPVAAKSGPFAALSGTDNLAIIRSETYTPERPIVITGPGAGVRVTATSVVADIVHVSSAEAAQPSGLYAVFDSTLERIDSVSGRRTVVGSFSRFDLLAQGEAVTDAQSNTMWLLTQNYTTNAVQLVGLSLHSAAVTSILTLPLAGQALVGVGCYLDLKSSGVLLVAGASISNNSNHHLLECTPAANSCRLIATRTGGIDVLGGTHWYSPQTQTWLLQFANANSIFYDGYDVATGQRVLQGIVEPNNIEAGVQYKGVFYGIGMQGQQRTVASWSLTKQGNGQLKSTFSVISKLSGWFIIQSGIATLNESQGVLYTLLQPSNNQTAPFDLVEVTVPQGKLVRAVPGFCNNNCPWELEYNN